MGINKIKGKVIINFEYDEENERNWDLKQEGKNNLDNENLVYLLQHIVGELASTE